MFFSPLIFTETLEWASGVAGRSGKVEVLGSLGIRGDHGFPSAPGMRTCGLLLHRPKVSPHHEHLSREPHLRLRATEQIGRATSNLTVWPSLSVCVNTVIPASETRLQHDWVHSLCSSYTIPPFLARRADAPILMAQ